MLVSAIVAMARNRVIGQDNRIPWYLSTDLKYFKRTTLGHHVIMGRKSFESIGRPLPKRTNVIISRNPYYVASNCLIARSVPEALAIAADHGETEAFIIGGGQIYELSWPYLDRIYLTEVDAEPEGDVFFPVMEEDAWQLVSSEAHTAGEKDDHDFVFKVFDRISNP